MSIDRQVHHPSAPPDHRPLAGARRLRRRLLSLLVLAAAVPVAAQQVPELRDGDILLLRHAHAPGVGDPPQLRLGDCSSQRNLDDAGRAQAQRIGQALRAAGARVGALWASQWCRTRDTASLAFPDLPLQEQPAFNSLFGRSEQTQRQTEAALALLRGWRGPGLLVVVTHQVNIRALTGESTASGEGLLVRLQAGRIQVRGRLALPG